MMVIHPWAILCFVKLDKSNRIVLSSGTFQFTATAWFGERIYLMKLDIVLVLFQFSMMSYSCQNFLFIYRITCLCSCSGIIDVHWFYQTWTPIQHVQIITVFSVQCTQLLKGMDIVNACWCVLLDTNVI